MGMRTPHWKSTSLEASGGVSAANAAAARESRKANSSTAERRACKSTEASLGSRVWGWIVERILTPARLPGRERGLQIFNEGWGGFPSPSPQVSRNGIHPGDISL